VNAMRLAIGVAACSLAVGSTGCTFAMHEYQAGGYAAPTAVAGPPRKGEWIHARAEQSVVLGITDNTDYVDHAYAELLSQCPGDVVGINTRYSTSLGFLSYTNVVDIQAMCLR
jgi:hypothetical protein